MTTTPDDTWFGMPGCTCRAWTRQDGPARYLEPQETVDKASGWERGKNCPHHQPTQPDLRQRIETALRAADDHWSVTNYRALADALLPLFATEREAAVREAADALDAHRCEQTGDTPGVILPCDHHAPDLLRARADAIQGGGQA